MFGLLPYFDHVQGTDGFPAKPEPDVIFASLKGLGAAPEDCLFVGDSPADMEAGRRAGVKTCAVLWGYGSREDMARWEPDYWVEHPGELIAQNSRSVTVMSASLHVSVRTASMLAPNLKSARCRSPCRARRGFRASAAPESLRWS